MKLVWNRNPENNDLKPENSNIPPVTFHTTTCYDLLWLEFERQLNWRLHWFILSRLDECMQSQKKKELELCPERPPPPPPKMLYAKHPEIRFIYFFNIRKILGYLDMICIGPMLTNNLILFQCSGQMLRETETPEDNDERLALVWLTESVQLLCASMANLIAKVAITWALPYLRVILW